MAVLEPANSALAEYEEDSQGCDGSCQPAVRHNMSLSSNSVAISSLIHRRAAQHLLRDDGQEDLAFAIWYPSYGATRRSALIQELILPLDGERLLHGNASFLPHYFERAIGTAVAKEAGLAFLHSHPAAGWQGMSSDDINAEQNHAAASFGATGLPLVGLTMGSDGAWSGRFWERSAPRKYERRWCSSVRVVGDKLSVTYMDGIVPPPRFRQEFRRTISAWGESAQANLARLHIGIIGLGSVGSVVAEALARTGVRRVALIDFDAIERINLDRVLHASLKDAMLGRSKVETSVRALRSSATADRFEMHAMPYSIAEEEGFKAALDCDLLFCCVDRPLGRSVLNFIAYAHLIPVVDGGISVERSLRVGLKRADWRAHVAAPERQCLECLEQYDPGLVAADREGYFDDPAYIAGLPPDHVMRRNENVFAFAISAASLEVLQMLMMVVAPLGISNPGEQTYHFVPGILDVTQPLGCKETCLYPDLTAKGDRSGLVVTGRHRQAEKARETSRVAHLSRNWRYRLADTVERLSERVSRRLVTKR
jgi:molybdopterin/thiamine biosynthesis adenylyltransferase